MDLLNFNFVIIYIIYKIWYNNKLPFFEKKLVFFTKYNDKNPRPEDQKYLKV